MVIVERRASFHFSKFLDLLKTEPEIKIKDVKKLVSHSSYYAIVIRKLYNFNTLLRELNSEFYLAKPSFSMADKTVFSAVKRCPLIEIESRKDFFILRFKE